MNVTAQLNNRLKTSLGFAWRLCVVLCALLVFAAPQAAAYTQNDVDCVYNSTCWYNPADCPVGGQATTAATTTNTLDYAAAEAAAKQASTGNTKVGFALYDSNSNLLANYNDTSENYGASITKSLILVAYLKQVASGTISAAKFAAEQGDVLDMIELSSDAAANNVFHDLASPAASVQAVATTAGMSGFKFNDTGDSLYVLGQSQITASDFAKFFANITQADLLPASELKFGETLLSTITPQAGLLQANLPGTVYSKEGWKPEPGGGSDPAISGSANPFGNEGAPWVVNQAGQFVIGTTTYGVAVTVGGTASEASGETIVKNVVSALNASSSTTGSGTATCCPTGTTSASTQPGASSGPNVKVAFTFFLANGFTPQQAAGIVGNLQEESTDNIDPTANNGTGNYGIAQWGGPRLTEMRTWISGKGGDPNSLGGQTGKIGQLDFIMQELKTNENAVDKAVKSESTINAVADEWNVNYEQSGAPNGPREDNAQTVYSEAQNDGWITSASQSPVTATTASCSNTTGDARCSAAGSTTGDPKILAEATCYNGLYYEYGGGHQGYAAFIKGCPNPQDPPNPPGNHPSGGPSLDGGQSGNPSPCATDCSALVSVAVDAAFNQNDDWDVGGIETSPDWKAIAMNAVQPGDVVTIGADEHVEIVDTYDAKSGVLETFGSHYTGTKTGEVQSTLADWTGAFQYIGPGA